MASSRPRWICCCMINSSLWDGKSLKCRHIRSFINSRRSCSLEFSGFYFDLFDPSYEGAVCSATYRGRHLTAQCQTSMTWHYLSTWYNVVPLSALPSHTGTHTHTHAYTHAHTNAIQPVMPRLQPASCSQGGSDEQDEKKWWEAGGRVMSAGRDWLAGRWFKDHSVPRNSSPVTKVVWKH